MNLGPVTLSPSFCLGLWRNTEAGTYQESASVTHHLAGSKHKLRNGTQQARALAAAALEKNTFVYYFCIICLRFLGRRGGRGCASSGLDHSLEIPPEGLHQQQTYHQILELRLRAHFQDREHRL